MRTDSTKAMPGEVPRCSIVIPAHNEALVIGGCIDSLLADAVDGEFLICVVANACQDDTAAIAKERGAIALTLNRPSKTAALNAGDAYAGNVFPRIYLDADVRVSSAAVRAVADALDTSSARAAAPSLRVDRASRSFLIRGYYNWWTQLPWAGPGLIGSGFYGLSSAGRARFGAFPEDLVNDDAFVFGLFGPEERLTISEHSFTVEAPFSIRSLVTSKSRVVAGNHQWRREALSPHAQVQGRRGALAALYVRILLRRPRLFPSLLAYTFVAGLILGHDLVRRLRRGDVEWAQDRTNREEMSRGGETWR